jgi:spore coat protein U-like protein
LTSLKVARRKVAVATLWVLPFLHHPSHAATVTSTLAMRMMVTSSCVINSAATLNFGNHGVLTSITDTITITVTY